MSDFQSFFYGLSGAFSNFWIAVVIFIALVIRLWRWELEQERIKKAT